MIIVIIGRYNFIDGNHTSKERSRGLGRLGLSGCQGCYQLSVLSVAVLVILVQFKDECGALYHRTIPSSRHQRALLTSHR